MKIRSPPTLHYPVTIIQVAAQQDEEVKRSALLFKYLYETTVIEGDKYGEEKEVKKKWPASFPSPADGTITKWFIKAGSEILHAGVDLVEIEEPCTHEVQFGSLCANCGKDMTEVDYLTEERNVDRATVNMTHDNVALLVSHKQAVIAEEDVKKRLLESKKLSLIVDLDQTVIHTTCERTIAEWQADPTNPNYEAVKDVRSFQLADDNVAHVAANWYYVKMRPGLQEFFERVSAMYEMHIYTMATRAYAQAVAKIIDPKRKYFGDRILSRDENYTDKLKSLHRLFPTNTDMVAIIDDRADIWHYSDNLVRVPVFNFFPGAGDINASFLPKQQELVTSATKLPIAESAPEKVKQVDKEDETVTSPPVAVTPAEIPQAETANGGLTEIEQQLISMGAGDDTEVLQQQAKEQEKVIITQQTERPLLQQQLLLDKEGEGDEEEIAQESAENGETQGTEQHRHRHGLLHDDDRGLEIIEKNLRRVHQAFYDEYLKKKTGAQGGRIAQLRGEKSPKKRPIEDFVPDIKILMPRLKHQVLVGITIVFSGIIPLGMDVQSSDFALWVKSFGAEVSLSVNKHTTHVIANPDRRTNKVKQAARYPHIKIVVAEWMFQCCTQWEHVDEKPYLIEIDPAERGGSPYEELEDDDDIDEAKNVEGEETTEAARLDMDNMSDEKWLGLSNEIDDFLNESDDTEDNNESDSDSVRSDAGAQPESKPKTRKRKRIDGSAEGSDAEDGDANVKSESKLQQRKKRTLERATSLTNVVTADKSSGLPSPETTGPEEEQGEDETGGLPETAAATAPDLDSDYDDGLEADFMAEFEKSASEDGEGDEE